MLARQQDKITNYSAPTSIPEALGTLALTRIFCLDPSSVPQGLNPPKLGHPESRYSSPEPVGPVTPAYNLPRSEQSKVWPRDIRGSALCRNGAGNLLPTHGDYGVRSGGYVQFNRQGNLSHALPSSIPHLKAE